MENDIKIWEADYENIRSVCKFDPSIKYFSLTLYHQNISKHHYSWDYSFIDKIKRNKWILSFVEQFKNVIEKSKLGVVSEQGTSLDDYYNSMASSVAVKLVECVAGETWAGVFIKNGMAHFMVYIMASTFYDTDLTGRKPKKVMKPDGKYYVACMGTDDFGLFKRNLTLIEAQELYDLIIDSTSQKELSDLGIVNE